MTRREQVIDVLARRVRRTLSRPEDDPDRPRPSAEDRRDRWLAGVVCGVLVAACLAQRPGETTFDTKFDLTEDPGAFLLRSLHLWNPLTSFGELQNQAYGYLFPQGIVAVIGHGLGLSEWTVQRLWSALLLILAYLGVRFLFLLLQGEGKVGSTRARWAAHAAGLSYAFAPRLLGLSGVLSAEVLPTAVLPWVVIPLVAALRGQLSPRTGALLSAATVLGMGGVNAVENLAALPLPFLVLLTNWRQPAGRRLLAWWLPATALAAVWWIAPLLVLGRYSPPFLDYIETSAAVVYPLGWTNAVRGADHWLAFLTVGGQPWWPGAYQLAYRPSLVLVTSLIVAVGVAGLMLPGTPLRRAWVWSLLLGLVCLTVARSGPLAAPVHGFFQFLLDGPLSMLRNVHKVDPLIRLPLALGLGHAVVAWWPPQPSKRRAVALGTVGVLILLSAQPLLGGIQRRPGWQEVPSAWRQAASYVADNGPGTTWILPGSGFGQQRWGWTIDEPIQGLAASPWVTRSQVPLAPGPTIRALDALEERMADGIGSPVLADYLRRAGITHVLLRRDLDLAAADVPSPWRVELALSRSPGLVKVASFGRSGFGDQPMLDVYAVRGRPGTQPQDPRVAVTDQEAVATMAGGPEDVISAMEAGAIAPDQPVRFVTESPDVVSDGYRRRERAYGRAHDAVSQVMAADEPYRIRRSANDYPGVPGQERAVARYTGLRAVTASTSGGYVDSLGAVRGELGPYSAVDGLADTYWQSAPFTSPVGQWVEVSTRDMHTLGRIRVVAGVDGWSGTAVREVEVAAGGRSARGEVDPETGEATVYLPDIRADRIRVTVTDAAADTGVVSLREITIPGVVVGRTIVVPDAGADGSTSFVFRAQPPRSACFRTGFGAVCDRAQARVSEEQRGFVRTFTTHAAGTWRLRGEVFALPGTQSQRLLEPYLRPGVRLRASSTFMGEPAVSPQFAYDGDHLTYWMPNPEDRKPTLRLRWSEKRRLNSLRLVAPAADVVTPTEAVIRAGSRLRTVRMGLTGTGLFPALRAQRISISFPQARAVDGSPRPIGIGELVVGGLGDLVTPQRGQAPTGAVCGFGPVVEIDGVARATRVRGRVRDLTGAAPLRIDVCDGPIRLAAGEHQLTLRSTQQFAATAISLLPQQATSQEEPTGTIDQQRAVDVLGWGSTSRSVVIGPGNAAVLRVAENFNRGWEARLNGDALTPTTIDGWQQGFEVPAGAGGEISLRFTPDRAYRGSLLVGLACAVLLVIGALGSWRRDRLGGSFGAEGCAHAATVQAPITPDPTPLTFSRRRVWGERGLATVLAVLVAGPAVAAGLIAALLVLRRKRWGVVVAPLLVAGSGAVAATAAINGAQLPPIGADVLAALGVGVLGATLLPTAVARFGAAPVPDASTIRPRAAQ